MKDEPIRLLDRDGATTSRERAALEAGLDVNPPPGAKSAVWTGLAAKLPPIGGGPGGGAGVMTGVRAALVGGWKAGAVGLALGLVVAGSAVLLSHRAASVNAPLATSKEVAPAATAPILAPDEPQTPVPRPALPRGTRTAPLVTASSTMEATNSEPAATSSLSIEPVIPSPPEARKSQLLDESRMLRDARTALRSGNSAGALAILRDSARRHPQPVLSQEHEALTIQALDQSGAKADARIRARKFVAQFPSSPLAAQLKEIARE